MIDLNPVRSNAGSGVKELHALLNSVAPREERRRSYLGASAIGGVCDRRLQYDFLQTPYDDGWRYSARTLRIFQRGHMVESAAAIWLADAGFRLTQTGKNGKPIGFSIANGAYAGNIDRAVLSGPLENLAYPFLWECKALGSKSWKAIESRGVEKASPQYADQMSQYQAYCDLENPALFFAVNMDTMELHMEFVPFNRARAQVVTDKAASIIRDSQSGYLRPRCTDDPSFFACSGGKDAEREACPFRQRCWS